MAAVINTNMASLQAQNQLSRTTNSLNNTIQQLSSGLRVNSAADDASGYAIAKNMDSVIKGSTVAVRNANDGISFSQTATGALDSLSNILSRMRELSTQASNEANGVTNVNLLQTEFKANQDELIRILANTKFNSVSVFSATTRSFQIGSGTSANDSISLTTTALGAVTDAAAAGELINGGSGSVPGIDIVNAIDVASLASGASGASIRAAAVTAVYASELSAANKDLVATEINDLTETAVDDAAAELKDLIGTIDPDGGFTIGDSAVTSLSTASTTAATNAQNATDAIDLAITAVNTEAATHGAFQNRMTFVANNLSNLIQTTSAAKSRIVDTDFAAQTAQLSKYQILQQAGTAMLAQANQMGSNVLTLLK
jgi:flagellin